MLKYNLAMHLQKNTIVGLKKVKQIEVLYLAGFVDAKKVLEPSGAVPMTLLFYSI